MGTREIVGVIDDPYQKAAHWLRQGARLFDIGANNPDACARWIALFGMNPEHWPAQIWYPLAVLLPSLQSLAGKEYGMRFALHLMLGLPTQGIRRAARFRRLAEPGLSLLGERMSRLGVDAIVGDRVEDLAQLTLVIGPVPLDTYYAFQEEGRKGLLDAVLYLIAPCHQRYRVAWSIEDRAKAPALGIEERNSRLGLNSMFGSLTGMNSDDLKLDSVNWEHGMLLTPEHFLRQERHFDSMLLWLLRYSTDAYGLVGGGPRLAEAERGAARRSHRRRQRG